MLDRTRRILIIGVIILLLKSWRVMRHHIGGAWQLEVLIDCWLLINELRQVVFLLVNEGGSNFVLELWRQVTE